MAEDKGNQQGFVPEIGDPSEGDTDFLFRTQMGVYNFFAGYWKQLLGLLGIFLLIALGASLYLDYSRDQQRALQAQIAEIERKMPQPDPMALMLGQPADDPNDEDRMANLQEGARRYEAVAQAGSGTGGVMAWLYAADAWKRAGDTERMTAALQQAHDAGATGSVGWSAAARLANAKATAGDVDGAVSLLEGFSSGEGFVAQHASLEMGLMLEAAGRAEEASTKLQGLMERFPDSPLAPQVAEALRRIEG